MPFLSKLIIHTFNDINIKKIQVYLLIRYFSLFLTPYLTFFFYYILTCYPFSRVIFACTLFIICNLAIYYRFKVSLSKYSVYKRLLLGLIYYVIFLLSLLILNYFCISLLKQCFFILYTEIFLFTIGSLNYDILYSSAPNLGGGSSNAGSSSNGNGLGGNGSSNNNGGGNHGNTNNSNNMNNNSNSANQDENVEVAYEFNTCSQALRLQAENTLSQRRIDHSANPSLDFNSVVTLQDLGINTSSYYYRYLIKFAREYNGDDAQVKTFCTKVLRKEWYNARVFNAYRYRTPVLDALAQHR